MTWRPSDRLVLGLTMYMLGMMVVHDARDMVGVALMILGRDVWRDAVTRKGAAEGGGEHA